jgi:hypothetical protein
MATKRLRPTPPVVGVVPGERATLELQIGPRYHKVVLEGTVKGPAGAPPAITDIFGLIRVLIDGKVQREHTVSELNALNALHGSEFAFESENLTTPGAALGNADKGRFRVCIYFAEPFRKSYAADQMMAWPTAWPGNRTLGNFQLTIDIPTTAGTSLHDIKAYVSTDDNLGVLDSAGNPLMNISKCRRSTHIYTAAGDLYITDLPRRDLYQELNFFTQAGDPVSKVNIKLNDNEILDVAKTVNDYDLKNLGLNAAGISANRFDVVFDRDDLPDSALPVAGARMFQVILTLSNAAAANKVITLISQTFGARE